MNLVTGPQPFVFGEGVPLSFLRRSRAWERAEKTPSKRPAKQFGVEASSAPPLKNKDNAERSEASRRLVGFHAASTISMEAYFAFYCHLWYSSKPRNQCSSAAPLFQHRTQRTRPRRLPGYFACRENRYQLRAVALIGRRESRKRNLHGVVFEQNGCAVHTRWKRPKAKGARTSRTCIPIM